MESIGKQFGESYLELQRVVFYVMTIGGALALPV